MTTLKKFDKAEETEKPEGQIQDFVSGRWVKAGPEEVDAVQIFSRRLIEDYDYPKSHIQTRPQYRVRKHPSDEEKSYPVDIAVFKNSRRIEEAVLTVVHDRVALRERLRRIPLWSQGLIPNISAELPNIDNQLELSGNPGFIIQYAKIQSNIFIPRYYNPMVNEGLRSLTKSHELISINDLVKEGVLAFETGVEVGKMAYGTGPVPFIRTSDISNWELKTDPKQSVSEDLYDQFKDKLDVQPEDLFVVRDGTYLVGTSCILTEHDTRILYCGGLYKIRVKKKDQLDPCLLLALLNCPIVKRQMRAKQFTRDVIDTLGKRIFEVILPIPKDKQLRERIARETQETVLSRVSLRNKAKQISLDIEGITEPEEEDKELPETI